MKAVISNRIYLSTPIELRLKIDEELRYVIPSYVPTNPPEIINNMSMIRSDLVSIPSGRTDLIPKGYEIKDKRVLVPVTLPEFKFTLRPSQKEIHDQVDDSCIINALVSWGKTFTALAIAAKLGQKTLIVVHNISLRNQWVKEIEKVFGFTPGIIGSGKFQIDTPIVVGNTQSLYKKLDKLRKEFGTLILDEMHHVSSKTFSSIVDSSHARYKIGLTGTLERKDGKHVVFRDYFGSTVFKPPRENSMTPRVEIINLPIKFRDGAVVPWAHRVNDLVNNEEYVHSVAMLAAAYSQRGYKVLLVASRVSFLEVCAKLIGDDAVCITGKVPEEDREKEINKIKSGEKTVLCGTQAIFSEGISVNPLSCIILGTPINNEPLLKQLIGRIVRETKELKLQPVVCDIHLKGNTARRQASARMGLYIKEGYEVKYL